MCYGHGQQSSSRRGVSGKSTFSCGTLTGVLEAFIIVSSVAGVLVEQGRTPMAGGVSL